MKNINKLFIPLIIIAILSQSCATILSGTSDNILFESEPPGAEVYVDGINVGKTNNTLEVKRKYLFHDRQVEYRLEGYENLNFDMELQIENTYWLNIFTLFTTGIIDIATGAALKPKDIHFKKTLTPK